MLYFPSFTQHGSRIRNFTHNMSGVQFLAQADCFFHTLLQPSSETHPATYPKITPGSYPKSKFSGTVTVLRLRNCAVLISCLYRDNLHFIQGPSMTKSINGGHMYKNTTHQNIIMPYLEFIFLNCAAVMPPTLPLTFRCLSTLQFPFTWW